MPAEVVGWMGGGKNATQPKQNWFEQILSLANGKVYFNLLFFKVALLVHNIPVSIVLHDWVNTDGVYFREIYIYIGNIK